MAEPGRGSGWKNALFPFRYKYDRTGGRSSQVCVIPLCPGYIFIYHPCIEDIRLSLYQLNAKPPP